MMVTASGNETMNKRIEQLMLDSCVIDYVDHETPRRYFVNGNAEVEDLIWFAKSIVRECADIASTAEPYKSEDLILKHFDVE